ncbi:unnamed protein product [Urochloa decumbens]|uniref:DUF4220 domain-containing protein n=1 Tax=Urochloa decumbens TaxID=240449 RepID=A0ABC9AI23_9POAL
MVSTDDLVHGGIIASAVLAVLLVALSTSDPDRKDGCAGTPPPPTGRNNPDVQHMWTLLLWVVLILTIKSNADAAAAAVTAAAASPAAGDGGADGQMISPPVEHLVQYGWVAYLIRLCVPLAGWLGSFNRAVFFAFSALGLVKLALKLAAFWIAADSFAVGKNAGLVAGYMAQLVSGYGDGQVPRYIGMGEAKKHVEESAEGYRIKRDVLDDSSCGGGCRGTPLADAGSGEALDFVLRGMDDGAGAGVDADRVFRVLVDGLWFARDFYYSPIPLPAVGGWLAALNYLCSVLLVVGAVAVGWIYQVNGVVRSMPYKVITFSLLLAVALIEAWEVVAGVCSNWTKMALLGHYVRHGKAWRRSGSVHAALAAVLRLRPATRWRHRIGQNSVLEPRRFLMRSGFLSERLYGKAGLMRSVPVSPAVKDAVIRSLLSSYGRMDDKGKSVAARRVGGSKVDWALHGGDGRSSSSTELILTWHVATRLYEMKAKSAPESADMAAACHLSYYCAYLAAAAPELLPDATAWTERRYREVSDDVRAALGADGTGSEPLAERYELVVAALSAGPRDKVLWRGAELGRRLVEEYAGDEPSENAKGHVEAMARGGEFITLVWALLLHAGVTTRPDTPPCVIIIP